MAYSITSDCTGCGACTRFCPVDAIRGAHRALHVVDPRLCIDCGACGRVCPAGAVRSPEGSPASAIKRPLWPIPAWNYRLCVDCKICLKACPTGSISLAGERVALGNPKACLGCALCVQSCPLGAMAMQSRGVG
jgi:ferredoxin